MPKVTRQKNGFSKTVRSLSVVGSFGLMMGASILIGYYLGSYIDEKAGTEPWFMIICLIGFMVGAFIKFFQSVREVGSNNGNKANR